MVSAVMIGLDAWHHTFSDSSSTMSLILINAIDACMFERLFMIGWMICELLVVLPLKRFSVGCFTHA
jgi:hypothetical protein